MPTKVVSILGGGTFSHVRNHLSLATPAFGATAIQLANLCDDKFKDMDVDLYLTKMANPNGPNNNLVTNEDVRELTLRLKKNFATKVIFFNVALCDYEGSITDENGNDSPSGKYEGRLQTSAGAQWMKLTPADKILKEIRTDRKDIFLVAFKTTCGATEDQQYLAGLNLLKKNSCNLVLANDTRTRVNMIITPEEARYCVTTNREDVLRELVDMAYLRSQLTFTKSTVVEGKLVPWESEQVFPALRAVVNHCIQQNAYKPFNGATVGHFACKISDNEFLTSVRKSNFNDLAKKGLVRIKTDGNDSVIAYGAKPSVGGQSQRIVFNEHDEYDCIVHFHCPMKKTPKNLIRVISQKEYECGSHQCGQNTSNGLRKFTDPKSGQSFSAVMLDNHGPNIVFNHDINPQVIIDFIDQNFDLAAKTGGLVSLEN